MLNKPSLIQRAHEMARSNEYPSFTKIEQGLTLEGYEDVTDHFASPTLRKEIRTIWKNAAAAKKPR